MKNIFVLCFICACSFMACDKTTTGPSEPKLIFKLNFDSTQVRLDAFAQPATIPAGNAAQHPRFNRMSAHKIELVPSNITPVNGGPIAYHGAETAIGGANAIKFDEAIVKSKNEVFVSIPLKDIATGNYPYIRVSVSYQNYDIFYNINNVPTFPSGYTNLVQERGTVASFVGFNSYITSLTPKNMTQNINANKIQGYWAFETDMASPYNNYNAIYSGTATSTTVVNPLSATTPTPTGSCLVTGTFASPLIITGNETKDIIVTLSFSTNKSFEWKDDNGNGELDIDATTGTTEKVVDMGLRGLRATFQ